MPPQTFPTLFFLLWACILEYPRFLASAPAIYRRSILDYQKKTRYVFQDWLKFGYPWRHSWAVSLFINSSNKDARYINFGTLLTSSTHADTWAVFGLIVIRGSFASNVHQFLEPYCLLAHADNWARAHKLFKLLPCRRGNLRLFCFERALILEPYCLPNTRR